MKSILDWNRKFEFEFNLICRHLLSFLSNSRLNLRLGVDFVLPLSQEQQEQQQQKTSPKSRPKNFQNFQIFLDPCFLETLASLGLGATLSQSVSHRGFCQISFLYGLSGLVWTRVVHRPSTCMEGLVFLLTLKVA